MLPVPFTFRGRIARLPYFKSCLALVAASFLPALLTLGALPRILAHDSAAIIGLIVMLVLIGITIGWISLALQVRRCRDIGWEPLYVISAWFALQFADPFLADWFPALAVGRHHNATMVGVLVNLFMVATLIFWPSSDADEEPSAPARELPPRIVPPTSGPLILRPAEPSMARTSFGRRR